MERRRYLALVGTAAALAGCGGGGNGTETEADTGTAAATDTATATGTATGTATDTATATEAAPTPPETETGTAAETDTETETEEPTETAEPVSLSFAAAPVSPDGIDSINAALHAAGLRDAVSLDLRETAERGLRQQVRNWTTTAASPPDLIVTDAAWTRSLLRDDLGLRLDDRFGQTTRTRVRDSYARTIGTVTDDQDVLRAVPLSVSVPTMLYRRDFFEDGGHPPQSSWATTPMTWQRFASIVDDLTNLPSVTLGFGFGAERYDGLACCLFNEVVTSWGGAYYRTPDGLLDPPGNRPVTIGEEPARNAMRMLRTFIHEDDPQALRDYEEAIASPEVLDWEDEEPRSRMANGNTAAIRADPSALVELGASDSLGTDLGAMPLPYAVEPTDARQPGAGGSSPSMGGWNVIVNPRSDDVSAAVAAAETMTTDEFHLQMLERANFVPPRPSLAETTRARSVEPLGRYMDTLRWSGENAIPRPATNRWYTTVSSVVSQEVHEALSQEQNPAEAARSLSGQLRRYEG